MGIGRLKRIAALTSLATASVMVAGVVNVPALGGLTTPTVTTTVPTTTVPSTTVTVPSTPVTPTTTVTTPTVRTPTVTTPSTSVPKPPSTSTPTVKTPSVKTPTLKPPSTTSGSPTSGGGGGGGGITQQVGGAVGSVGGVTSGGTSKTVSGVTGTAGGTSGGGGTAGGGTATGTNPALQALSAFDGGGGPGGTAGPGGSGFGGGSGGGTFGPGGGPGSGGKGLPPTLSAAGAKHLRAALELLADCMSAIAPIDRQVLSMRAGGAGTAPLSRPQVASQLGVSNRQVRLSERRGLSGLRTAAEQTGCAGPVGGPFAVSSIGPLPLAVPVTTLAAVTAPTQAAFVSGGGGPYVPARQAEPGVESPLARLTGGRDSGPAWLVVIVTVLFSVAIAGLMREVRHSVGA